VDYITIVELIAATTSTTNLTVCCELDQILCPADLQISDAVIDNLNIVHDSFQGEWNYTVMPKEPKSQR